MSLNSGFDEVQACADADIAQVRDARTRRDLFRRELPCFPDVIELRPSGSLARGTHIDPIHDVDLVAVFSESAHPKWGKPGGSAEEALEHARKLIKDCLGSDGTGDVRHTRVQNHSVKCFLDDPDDPDAFTVNITPALVQVEGGILIPEKNNKRWVASDPQFLMDEVARRHDAWKEFTKLVRVLKRWNRDHGKRMKDLVVEVLALTWLNEADRPTALAQFFTAAAVAVWCPIRDPANLCGLIQPDLDKAGAHAALADAADHANRALEAAARDENSRAMCLWRKVFGPTFPES